MLNLKHFKSITLGDSESEKKILVLLKESEKRFLTNIQKAIDSGDEKLWQNAMHEMKGGAASVGAEKLYEFCEKFEKNKNKKEWPEILETAKKEFQNLNFFIEKNF